MARAKTATKTRAQATAKPARKSSRKKAADTGASPAEIGVTITHPDKVMFPDDGITKGEMCAYYEAIAPVMLPHIIGRPVTMERFNRGIGQEGFIQKNVAKGFPDWLERVELAKKGGTVHYPVIRDARGLVWLANQNCITPHVFVSRVPHVHKPDICVFDLDPSGNDDESRVRAGALFLRDMLAELGLETWVKTSGSKGFHIVVPLDGKADSGKVARFAHGVGEELVRRDPKNFTREFHKADRGGRIFVDTGRNEYGATFAAAYAVRPKPGAPISAPCTWEEIERGKVGPRTFTLRDMTARVAKVGDLWAEMLETRQSLP
ncbi:MAG TPA: non-homologous end-joining DNA ligase [Gemmatimonadaceae bacterium]|nr:non-homologous end-joining DNA ligase [Gemmatimonadaceae bacterium]